MDDNIEKKEENIDDVIFEETVEGESEAYSQDKIKKLREELKKAQSERMEYLTNWQRERADFTNYKKDEIERTKSTVSFTREKFIIDLLPVLDSYDMAFSNKEAWEKVDVNWRMGVEYIHQQLLKVLEDNGVSEIGISIGDLFDPNVHQPIESIETDEESKDNTIERIIQKGYKTKDKTIRPARVNVFSYKKD